METGYRVVWQTKTIGSKIRFTVYYKTKEHAERMADSILRDGYHVKTIEFKQ